MQYKYDYPRALVTVDAIIIDKTSKDKILLIKRENEPYKGMWALPGGFIEMEEDLIDSVNREVKEETNLENINFKQFAAYGTPGRDPRDRNIAVVFYGYCETPDKAKAGDDAAEARWVHLNKLPELGFDHSKIINDYVLFAK